MYVVHVVSCSFIIKWWLEIFIHFFPHCPPLASCRFIGQSVCACVCMSRLCYFGFGVHNGSIITRFFFVICVFGVSLLIFHPLRLLLLLLSEVRKWDRG